MGNKIVLYVGWIGGKESDRETLERLGVKLGSYNSDSETWDGCEVPEKVLGRLDKLWGKYIWGLTRTVRDEHDPSEEDIPF
ncbi:MAG: hypothetical protein ACREDF_04145 [Thermoplasmata archaeon]